MKKNIRSKLVVVANHLFTDKILKIKKTILKNIDSDGKTKVTMYRTDHSSDA